MSRIDRGSASLFFADLLIPLSRANRRRNITYLTRPPGRQTYWEQVASRTGGLQKLSAADAGGAALLEFLGPYWSAQRDPQLRKLLPYLQELHREMAAPPPGKEEDETRVSDFVYVLF